MRLRSSFAFLTPVAAVLCAASAVRAQAPAHTPAATSATAAATTPVATQAPAPAQDLDACIGASEQAVAARKAGKLLEARKQLTICSAPACPEAMRASCQQRNADSRARDPAHCLPGDAPRRWRCRGRKALDSTESSTPST